jgi:hypothetical protein
MPIQGIDISIYFQLSQLVYLSRIDLTYLLKTSYIRASSDRGAKDLK